jgi:hypothetical protein
MEDDELRNSYEELQRNDARHVLRRLALGLDPDSGTRLVGHEVLQNPATIRALLLAIESLTDDEPKKSRRRKEHDNRAGQPWASDEDEQLTQEFEARMSLSAISEIHKRTKGSITSRLVRLKLVDRREDARGLLK